MTPELVVHAAESLDLARRYCASHPETLALVTPDDGSERPVVVGAHAGAALEVA